jgi:hypothetical protein
MNNKKLKATWTRQMAEELKYCSDILEYKYENKKDIKLIEKYFKSDFTSSDSIYYTITIKMLRNVKLLMLAEYKLAERLKYIINNSKPADIVSLIEEKLSEEISREIDKEILRKIMNGA